MWWSWSDSHTDPIFHVEHTLKPRRNPSCRSTKWWPRYSREPVKMLQLHRWSSPHLHRSPGWLLPVLRYSSSLSADHSGWDCFVKLILSYWWPFFKPLECINGKNPLSSKASYPKSKVLPSKIEYTVHWQINIDFSTENEEAPWVSHRQFRAKGK